MKEYQLKNLIQPSNYSSNNNGSKQQKKIMDNRSNNSMFFQDRRVLSGIYEYKKEKSGDMYIQAANFLQGIDKDEFLQILKNKVIDICNELLAKIQQTANDCPYIRNWFNYYANRDMASIIRAISRFAPLSNNAIMLEEYLNSIVDRVRIGLQKHIDTGTFDDFPEEIKTGEERSENLVHIRKKNAKIMQLCKCDSDTDMDDGLFTMYGQPEQTRTEPEINIWETNVRKHILYTNGQDDDFHPGWTAADRENHYVKYENNYMIVIAPFQKHAYSDRFTGCVMAVFKIQNSQLQDSKGELCDYSENQYCVAHVAARQIPIFELACEEGYFKDVQLFKPTDLQSTRKNDSEHTQWIGMIRRPDAEDVFSAQYHSYNPKTDPTNFTDKPFDATLHAYTPLKKNVANMNFEEYMQYYLNKFALYGIPWLVGQVSTSLEVPQELQGMLIDQLMDRIPQYRLNEVISFLHNWDDNPDTRMDILNDFFMDWAKDKGHLKKS